MQVQLNMHSLAIAMPKSWNLGTVTYQVFWSPSNTDTGNCIFGLQGVATTEGDTADASFWNSYRSYRCWNRNCRRCANDFSQFCNDNCRISRRRRLYIFSTYIETQPMVVILLLVTHEYWELNYFILLMQLTMLNYERSL